MSGYQLQWRQYRRLWIFWVTIFASFVPVTLGLTILSHRLFRTDAPAPYIAGFLISLWLFFLIRICMGECFIGRWWYGTFPSFRKFTTVLTAGFQGTQTLFPSFVPARKTPRLGTDEGSASSVCFLFTLH
jgi:hypothetical protein